MNELSILSKSSKDTKKLANKIANFLSGGEVLLLEGDLGGGKTTFTQGLLKILGVKETVTSPTFVLKKTYNTNKQFQIEHIDLYRINSKDIDLDPSLLENMSNSKYIYVIEWGKKIQENLDHYLIIKFEYIDINKRQITIRAIGQKEQKILKHLK